MLILMSLLALAPGAVNNQTSRMAALYEEVCLKTFPDDRALDAAMKARGATELTRDQVRVTLRDDPGRAWRLADGTATVWLELPPFHACSVRWNSSEIPDFDSYRPIAERYEEQLGGFSSAAPWDADQGEIHIHATGEQKKLPNGGWESLFIFEQHITDPKRRTAGETGRSLRFVHQFAPPEPTAPPT